MKQVTLATKYYSKPLFILQVVLTALLVGQMFRVLGDLGSIPCKEALFFGFW
jgi:hypothetical protein